MSKQFKEYLEKTNFSKNTIDIRMYLLLISAFIQ